ncbi:MAG: TonB-dependent receptor [Steroidobacteraceae bacterium]
MQRLTEKRLANVLGRCTRAGAVCCVLLSTPVWAADGADARESWIEIPAGDLVTSLERLAGQSGIEFIYDSDQLKGIKAQGVSGHLTPKAAVMKLLEGTELTLTEHNGALLIAPRQGGGQGEEDTRLDEIVVTGTHIRGAAPVGSPLVVYSRSDIEASGSATLEQFARTVMGNAASVDTIANPASNIRFSPGSLANGINTFQGASFNLHGLGPTTTLTLLNGQRLAPGGLDGSFTDISQIPLSAVDHIEVLADGASAIYGADAVGGVVNIITRKDFSGAQSTVRYGGSTEGGADEATASQLFGDSWGTGNVLLTGEWDDQPGLGAAQRSYVPDLGGPYSLLPENRRASIFISGRQEWGPKTTMSADVLYSDRRFTDSSTLASSADSFRQSTYADGSARQLSATASIDRALRGDWHAELTGSYSRNEEMSRSTTAVMQSAGNPNEALLQGATPSILDVNAMTQGSLLAIPGGPVKAALGVSARAERYDSIDLETIAGRSASSGEPPSRREVLSAYGEIVAPVFGDANAVPGYRRLDVSIAGRFDHYSDFGSTLNPKLGMSWEFVRGVYFKGTFGTSFQAPLLNQVHTPLHIETELLPDSSSVSGSTDALILQGGNLNLLPEKSQSYTAGFDFKPARVPGYSSTLSFFHIKFTDKITTPPTSSGGNYSLSDPLLLPFIARDPALATVLGDFNSPEFSGDLAGLGPSAVQAIFDDRLTNTAATVQSGVDLRTRYTWALDPGAVNLSLGVERLLENEAKTVYFAPAVSLLTAFAEPPAWKGRAAAVYTAGPVSASAAINYVNSYRNSLFTPAEPIGSWTTGDVYLSYRTGDSTSLPLHKWTIALSVTNVTDARPPRVQIPVSFVLPGQSVIPFDPANASPVGRVIALTVGKLW